MPVIYVEIMHPLIHHPAGVIIKIGFQVVHFYWRCIGLNMYKIYYNPDIN
jgi:hypothetical protein